MPKRKGGMNTALVTVGVIAVVVIAVLLVMGSFGLGQTQLGTSDDGSCAIDTTISPSFVNGINKGTSVSPTNIYAIKNGQYIGNVTSATVFAPGDELVLHPSISNYIDSQLDPITLKCGVNAVQGELFATSTNTFRVFNTDGNPLTDNVAGGATNQTQNSIPLSIGINIDSTTDESTGDLVIVVESTNTTEVDDMVLSGLGGATKTDVPEFYTVAGAGSIARAYEVPAVLDGASVSGTLTINPESSQTIGIDPAGNIIYITAYSKQVFVDVDGSFKYGVEDSDGTTKYEDTWDFDFAIS